MSFCPSVRDGLSVHSRVERRSPGMIILYVLRRCRRVKVVWRLAMIVSGNSERD